MNLTQFIADLKDLINLEPAKRNLFISIALFISINGYLYSDNQDLKEQIKNSKKNCDEVLVKAQNDYLIQLDNNRKIQQEQLNKFYIESNEERDSVYRFFEKKIQTLQRKVNSGINDLKEIKDENTH
jgi:hypothetical protein